MAFLVKEDYYTQVRQLRLEQMTEGIEAVFIRASKEAVAVAKNYLFTLYDVNNIFSKQGEERDELILLHTKNIAIYLLHQRLPNAMIPPHVETNYNNTLSFLDDVAKGRIDIDLPRRQNDTNGDGINDTDKYVFRWGSRNARSH